MLPEAPLCFGINAKRFSRKNSSSKSLQVKNLINH